MSRGHCLMPETDSSRCTGAFFMRCTIWVCGLIGLTRNLPGSLARFWVSTTRTAIVQCTTRWRVWHRNFLCDCPWLMVRAISAAWMGIRQQQCVTPRQGWLQLRRIYWPILKKILLSTAKILMLRLMSQRSCPLLFQTCLSMGRLVSLWACLPMCLRII